MSEKVSENLNIIFWGGTGQSIMLAEIADYMGLKLVAIFDNNICCPSPWPNIPIFYNKSELINFKNCFFAVAIGGWRGKERIAISKELVDAGLKPITMIHPTAYISPSSTIGQGGQILPRAMICPRAIIGEDTIINTGAQVDHESVVGAGSHVSVNATLCGKVKLEPRVFVGAGAVVMPNVVVGEGAIIGAGAVVTKSVAPGEVIAGVPAKPITKNY
jgi:sugar O-acyltransferase (sialic acid O-acetyltransferase NeuD family)